MAVAKPHDPHALARESLAVVLSAQAPTSLTIARRQVSIVKSMMDDTCAVLAKWDGGKLRIRIATDGKRSSSATSRGKPVALRVGCGDKKRVLFSAEYERRMRAAIQDGARYAAFVAQNTVLGSVGDTKDKPHIAACRDLGRAIAEEAGLVGYPGVELAQFDLESGKWNVEPSIVLGRLLTLAVIKANFVQDGAPVIEGRPLFELPNS